MTPLFDATKRLYGLMEEDAETNDVGELVYQGSLTKLFNRVDASTSYYSHCRQLLLSPDTDPCIEIRQQGNSYQPSVVVLRHAPPEAWKKITPGDLTGPNLPARMERVEGRIDALESWREAIFKGVNLLETLTNLEGRLSQLERETSENGKESQEVT